MRSTSICLRLAAVLAAGAVLVARPAAAHDQPLGGSQLKLADGVTPAKRRMVFQARWKGTLDQMPNPGFEGATLRVSGSAATDGDTGVIKLVPGAWSALPKGRGYKYQDDSASAGGVRSILLKVGRKGGVLKIAGGAQNWAYRLQGAQSAVDVTLRIGELKFCAEFKKPKTRGSKLSARSGSAPASCPCEHFSSTFEAIQKQIFERHGCTAAACHGSGVSGGLDLRPDVAYQNLIDVPSPTYGIERVRPGGKQDSFLWQKLAAGRGEWDLQGKGSPMPNGAAPLGADELDVIGRWIHDGARQDGVVAGTEDALSSCLPPLQPPSILPPAPPAPGTGVQFHAAPWSIQPAGTPARAGLPYGGNGEDEVCFASYFDLLRDGLIAPDKVFDCPPYWQGPTNPSGKCYAYNHDELTQEPNSHHSIIHIYRGQFGATDPGFNFRCHDGETPGAPCDPAQANTCPAGQECRGSVKSSLACLTFGPADYTNFSSALAGTGGANSPAVGGSQQPFLRRVYPDGVFNVFPVQGVIVWNSHAFNVYDVPVQNQQWWNLYYVDPTDPAELRYPVQGIFDANDIFVQNVPPFEQREYCRTITFGKGTRLFELSSHNHRFGKRFRVFAPPIAASCRSTIDNPGACTPESTDPILVTTQYNDPAQVHVAENAPYHALDSDDPAQRRLKFCALYDNGKTDPSEVKRNSRSPSPPSFGNLAPGGPCYYTPFGGAPVDEGIACLSGPQVGQACGGNDRSCDSAPDANDGVCDACPVKGGVTTEDEMFILIGNYYCDPSVPGESCSGMCASGPNAGQACHGNDSECPGPAGECSSGKCAGGPNRGDACATDADCPRSCLPYTN